MIQVRDSKNPARILGTLAKTPALPQGHRFIAFAVVPTVLAYWNGPQDVSPTATYQTITLEVAWRYSEGGWRKDAHLITDAPLDQLMLLGDFLLPGEDPRAADDRRYSAALFRDPRRK